MVLRGFWWALLANTLLTTNYSPSGFIVSLLASFALTTTINLLKPLSMCVLWSNLSPSLCMQTCLLLLQTTIPTTPKNHTCAQRLCVFHFTLVPSYPDHLYFNDHRESIQSCGKKCPFAQVWFEGVVLGFLSCSISCALTFWLTEQTGKKGGSFITTNSR